MKVELIVLRDETRSYRDRSGVMQTRRTVHGFPTEQDGAKREMDIVVPLEAPKLQPYRPAVFAITDWRAFQSDIVFEGHPLPNGDNGGQPE